MKFNKGFLITVVTVAIPLFIQLIYIRFVSYKVSPEVFGNFTLLLTLVAAISSILLTIPNAAFVRYFNETKNKHNFINEFRLLLIPINILSFFIIIIYAYFMHQFDYFTLILMYIFLFLQNNISLNRQIILQNIERKKYLLINILEKSSKFFFPILLFYFYETLNSLVFGLLTGSILLTLTISYLNKRYTFQFKIDKRKLKIYFYYAYPIVFTSVFSWIIVFSDRYFINYYLDASSVGIYSLLAQVAAFTSILNALFSMYVNPIIYKLYSKNKSEAIKKLFSYLRVYITVLVILLVIALLLPRAVYTILLNPNVVSNDMYYTTLIILICGSIFSILQNSLSLFFTLEKKISVLGKIWFFAAVLNLIGNFYISEYGVLAAGLSTMFAYFLVMILNLIWIKKVYKGKVFD